MAVRNPVVGVVPLSDDDRRESRRRPRIEVPHIVGAQIDGQNLDIVDISHRGLLLEGRLRKAIDQSLRIKLIRADDTVVRLTGRVARAFVARLREDDLLFRLGVCLDDLMPWLDFEEASGVLTIAPGRADLSPDADGSEPSSIVVLPEMIGLTIGARPVPLDDGGWASLEML